MKDDEHKIRILNKLVEHYGYQNWWEDENWLKDCVSMILIQQSTQQNVEKALNNLMPYLNLDDLNRLDEKELENLIRPSGFFKQKTRYIKNIVDFFLLHEGNLATFKDYPTAQLREQLSTIKGVGQETADVMLLYLFNRKVFIADNYAIRLFHRLGFAEYKNYQAMKKEFEPLVEKVSLKQCKEWHACIDVHGKALRQNPTLNEHFLMK